MGFTIGTNEIAQANIGTMLVGNLDQEADSSGLTIDSDLSRVSQAFATGSYFNGYELTSLVLDLDADASDRVRVQVYSDNAGDPGSFLYALNEPKTRTTGENNFSTPPGAALSPLTTYHVVIIYRGSEFGVMATGSRAVDSGSLPGWSMGDPARTYIPEERTWQGISSGLSLQMEVRGFELKVPASPTGLAAVSITTARVDLSWSQPDDEGGPPVDGYRIEWSPDGGHPWRILKTDTGNTGTNYSDTTIAKSTTRHYRVRSLSGLTSSLPSLSESARTLEAGSSVASTLISNFPTSSFTIEPTRESDQVLHTMYTAIAHRISLPDDDGIHLFSSVSFKILRYNAGDDISVSIRADNRGNPGKTLATLDGPSSLANGKVTFEADEEVVLRSGADYHIVIRKTSGDRIGFESILWENLNENTRSGWSVGGTVRFYAPETSRWYNEGLPGVDDIAILPSGPLSFEVKGHSFPVRTPGPAFLEAQPLSSNRIRLSWKASADNDHVPATSYRLEVSPNGDDPWVVLAENIDRDATSFIREAQPAGKVSYYRIFAIGEGGESPASETASAVGFGATVGISNHGRRDAEPFILAEKSFRVAQAFSVARSSGLIIPGSVAIILDSVDTGERVLVSVHADESGEPGRPLFTLSAPSSLQNGRNAFYFPPGATLEPDKTYHVVVTRHGGGFIRLAATGQDGEDARGTHGWSIEHGSRSFDTTLNAWIDQTTDPRSMKIDVRGGLARLPNEPGDLTAEATGTDAIALSWDAPSDEGDFPVTSYRLETLGEDGITWLPLEANSVDTGYVHTGLTPGATRQYRVFAISAVGMSAPSAIAAASTHSTPALTSNLGQTLAFTEELAVTSCNYPFSQPFTTGVHTEGYYLDSVVVDLAQGGLVPVNARVSIWDNSLENPPDVTFDGYVGTPGSELFSLGARRSSGGRVRYHAPSGTRLESFTTYHLVVEDAETNEDIGHFFSWQRGEGTGEDAGGAPGWEIESVPVYYDLCTDIAWIHDMDFGAMRMAIHGGRWVAPDTPVNLIATASGETSVDLAWEEPVSDGHRVTGYGIEWAANASGPWNVLVEDTASTGTHYWDATLGAGETRHYRVFTIAPAGRSTLPATATATAMAMTKLVSNFEKIDSTDAYSIGPDRSAVWQDFTTGDNPGGYILRSISVYVQPNQLEELAKEISLGVFADDSGNLGRLQYSLIRPDIIEEGLNTFRARAGTALMPSTTYYFGVTYTGVEIELAKHIYGHRVTDSPEEDEGSAPGWSIGDGLYSYGYLESIFRITSTAIKMDVIGFPLTTAPEAPTNFSAATAGRSRIDLSWTGPEPDGVLALAGYRIEWATGPNGPWLTLEANAGLTTSYTHSLLESGVTYYYRVYAISGAGTSQPSNTAVATTNAPGPVLVSNVGKAAATTVITLDGTNLKGASQGFTTGRNADGYLLESIVVKLDELGSYEDFEVNLHADSLGYPTGGSLVQLGAEGSARSGEVTFEARRRTLLQANTTYHVVIERKSNELAVVFTSDNGENAGGAEGWSIKNNNITTAPNFGSTQNDGSPLQISVLGWGIGAPQRPTNLAAKAVSDSQVDLTWEVPADQSGIPISGYRIEWSDGGPDWMVVSADSGDLNPLYSDTSATPRSLRYYRVRAVASSAVSEPSNVAYAVTDIATGQVLTSNIGEPTTFERSVDDYPTLAQPFTTGTHRYGYTLGAVALEIKSGSRASENTVVEVYKEAPDNTANVVYVLTAPPVITDGKVKFLAPAGAVLAPSTTYYVGVSRGSGSSHNQVAETTSDKEDEDQPGGWRIANTYSSVTRSNWVVGEVFSGSMKIEVTGEPAPASGDATVRTLNVAPRNILGFDPELKQYAVGVAHTVTQATFTVAPEVAGSTWTSQPGDANSSLPGVQLNLQPGSNRITFIVTAEDRTTTERYTVRVNRGAVDAFGWRAVDDLDGMRVAESRAVRGVWSDGIIILVTDREQGKLFAYRANGVRTSPNDVDLHSSNANPGDIASDGTTVWVADAAARKLFGYSLSTGSRDPSGDIGLHADNDAPTGIWTDGETMWVANATGSRVFSYSLSDGARASEHEITLVGHRGAEAMASDGALLWVADDNKLYAFSLANGARVPAKDFNTLVGAGNTSATDIWTNGETLLVSDSSANKVFSYNMPQSNNADLRLLAVDGVGVAGFDPGNAGEYRVAVASDVSRVTVSAEQLQLKARITGITPTDADIDTDGHQVDLVLNGPLVVATVVAQDGTTREYELRILNPDLMTLPVIHSAPDGQVSEGSQPGQRIVVISASDPDSVPLAFTLDPASARVFDIVANADEVSAGILTKAKLDYEQKRQYTVTVTVMDPFGSAATATLTISVSDADDPGVVSMQPLRPSTNANVEAALWDDDGGIGGATWRWYRGDTETSPWSIISGAVTAFYTPGQADVGKYLRATVAYSDSFGSGKSAAGVSDGIVEAFVDQSCGPASAGILPVGRPARGDIESGDCDWFRMELEANRVYRLDMRGASTGHGSLKDPYLTGLSAVFKKTLNSQDETEYVYQPDGLVDDSDESIKAHWYDWDGTFYGNANYYNDDGGLGYDARMYFRVYPSDAMGTPQGWPAGVHYVGAGTLETGETGSYEISLIEVIDDDEGTGRTIELGIWEYRAIDYPGDRDFVEVELTAGTTYVIEFSGVDINGVRDIATSRIVRPSESDLRAGFLEYTPATSGGHGIIIRQFGQTRQAHADDRYRLRVRDTSVDVPENNPASGLPVFATAPFVGQWLTADTSGISDSDGLSNVVFEYRWYRSGVRLGRYSGSRYLLQSSDVGHSITVQVRFLDDAGFAERSSSQVVTVSEGELTAEFQGVPAHHDGQNTFTLRVLFSEDVDATLNELRDYSFTVIGGTLTGVSRANNRDDLWELTVQPSGNDVVDLELPSRRDCSVPGAICTDQGVQLSARINTSVPGPLVAEFNSPLPASHDGSDAFTLEVLFSDRIDAGWEEFRDHSFTVTGGTVSAVMRIDGRSDLWQITIQPEDAGAVTVELRAGRECTEAGAICTFSGIQLARGIKAIIGGLVTATLTVPEQNSPASGQPDITGNAAVGSWLGVNLSAVSDPNGLSGASYSYQWFRSNDPISGATTSSYTVVRADGGHNLKVTVSFTDDDGFDENVTSEAVSIPLPPLTADLERSSGTPANHDGHSEFAIQLNFSESFEISYVTIRDYALVVTNATVTNAARIDPSGDEPNLRWRITIEPANNNDIEVAVRATTGCDDDGAICAAGDRMLSSDATMTIAGPP